MPATRSEYSQGLAFFGALSPRQLVEKFGSPLYVYNEQLLRTRCREMRTLSSHPGFSACFSTKANGNPHLLRIIREEGLSADAMSPGELTMLHKAGFNASSICYVCNNVAPEELSLAAREASLVSVDSLSQLECFGRLHPGGSVMVRVNPGIGAGHHAKVVTAGKNTKFGVVPEDFDDMRGILARHNLTLEGLNQHVGSLFMDAASFLEAAAWLLETARAFPGISVIDFGGGFGIPYHKYEGQARLDLAKLGSRLTDLLTTWSRETGYTGRFVVEPGRYAVAESSILLGSVHAVKNNGLTRYVGTDLGFSILARPMMYDAFHDIEVYPKDAAPRSALRQTIVGNICETGDVLAKDREIPELVEGDTIGVLDAGAYGHAMSSSYNQRFRPAEVLIQQDGTPKLIRRRETVEDLLMVFPEIG